ncbi:chromosome segregation protein [Cyclospora cayetanensis]|uniref:Chromosome segregation protein n=1 Tax=Cyclospora cayetanensis TaxID=88456 RepID=A0A1D3CZ83_9EIME|nr:chromosome segregation protein [Cyclospora cayetanensis]
MARLSKELKLSQAELRDLLLEREQQQQQRSLAAKLHVQQLRLEAELKDCRNRLQDATETAEAAGAELKQQNLRRSCKAPTLERLAPVVRGSWSDVQQFLSASEASHQPDSFSSLSAFFSMDWNALPSNLRQVDQKLEEVKTQLQQQEEAQQSQRLAATQAEDDLKALRINRKNAFMRCFLHCQKVLTLIFAHLSAGGPLQDQQELHQESSNNLLMLQDDSMEPWQQQQPPHQRHQFDCVVGQAFLDLESSTALARDEEPFNWLAWRRLLALFSLLAAQQHHPAAVESLRSCYPYSSCMPVTTDCVFSGVLMVCKYPTKRFMEFGQLSGGEQHLADTECHAACPGDLPVDWGSRATHVARVPFLLLDEVDAHLDRTRLGRLAALIREISGNNKIQSVFVTHKEKLFTAADLLIGVVGDAARAESRCFLFDIRPYRQREQPCPFDRSDVPHPQTVSS